MKKSWWKQDHVCGEYKNNYRNVSNFLKSNVVVMDCDNDHSGDPAEWVTAEKLDRTVDEIRRRFGYFSIQRAAMYQDKVLSHLDAGTHMVHPHSYFHG